MTEMMKGLIHKEKGVVELGERPVVEPGPGEILVRTTAVSVCETDYEIIESMIMPPSVGRFVGHEGVGVVERVGEGVEYFKPGDRILAPPVTPSWSSIEAQLGVPQFSRGGMAFDWCLERDGVYGTYFRLREGDMNGAKIPDNVTDTQAVIQRISSSLDNLDSIGENLNGLSGEGTEKLGKLIDTLSTIDVDALTASIQRFNGLLEGLSNFKLFG